tara:strand:+ start:1057 stop:1260 length:204 start_codon:yes stop_codon:yes gene_type:complete
MTVLSESGKIVIIGGGQAGAQAAQSLRLFGYEVAITLVGDEPALPYQRPRRSRCPRPCSGSLIAACR